MTALQPAKGDTAAAYGQIYTSSEFADLRNRFRRFVFPVTGLFLGWYALYVALATFAHDFMASKVVGNINVGLVFGVLQFVSTFAIAYWYSRKAGRDLDPLADSLRAQFEGATR